MRIDPFKLPAQAGSFGNGKTTSTSVSVDVGIALTHLLPQASLYFTGANIGEGIAYWTDPVTDRGFALGLALRNLGPELTLIDAEQSDPQPAVLILGACYWPVVSEAFTLLLATDFEKQLYESSALDHIHLGSEARLLRLLHARVGYSLDTYAAKNSYFTVGGGLKLKYFSFNLARYTRALLPSWHFDGTFSLEL